ncbi:MAG: RidA family protein [Rhodospirillales bacterium]
MKVIETKNAPPAFSAYAQATEISAGARWVHVSGQVGLDDKGQLPADFDGQARWAFRNVISVVRAAGMQPGDIAKVTVYLTRQQDVAAYRRIRDEELGVITSSTLLVIAGLASPDWLVEIEAVAAAV